MNKHLKFREPYANIFIPLFDAKAIDLDMFYLDNQP
jgi:hypothetical protein